MGRIWWWMGGSVVFKWGREKGFLRGEAMMGTGAAICTLHIGDIDT